MNENFIVEVKVYSEDVHKKNDSGGLVTIRTTHLEPNAQIN